eukprot:m.167149 g.167149  ORF g.167149 m.167149 type:complete len:163 (+) comp18185_c0_seq3:98-586(+)
MCVSSANGLQWWDSLVYSDYALKACTAALEQSDSAFVVPQVVREWPIIMWDSDSHVHQSRVFTSVAALCHAGFVRTKHHAFASARTIARVPCLLSSAVGENLVRPMSDECLHLPVFPPPAEAMVSGTTIYNSNIRLQCLCAIVHRGFFWCFLWPIVTRLRKQ